MKVKELKEILMSLPSSMDDIEITSDIAVGCCGDTEFLTSMEVDFDTPESRYPYFRIGYSDKLPGMRSCRQYAHTLKEDEAYWSHFKTKPEDETK